MSDDLKGLIAKFAGGGSKFFGGGSHLHGHRHFRFGGYGYAGHTCWKYTPYGVVNVCSVLYY